MRIRPTIEREFANHFEHYLRSKIQDERVYDAVNVLTTLTPNVAFSTIPSADRMFFLDFRMYCNSQNFRTRYGEWYFSGSGSNFRAILDSLEIADEPRIFIGSENAIPEIQSCSLIVSAFSIGKNENTLGF